MTETSDALLSENKRISDARYYENTRIIKMSEGNIIVFSDIESVTAFYDQCLPVAVLGLLNIDDCRIINEDEEKIHVYHPAFRICDIYQRNYRGRVEKYAVKSLYVIQRTEGK